MTKLMDEYSHQRFIYPNAYLKLYVNGNLCVHVGYTKRAKEYPEALAHRVESILKTALEKYPEFTFKNVTMYCESGWIDD